MRTSAPLSENLAWTLERDPASLVQLSASGDYPAGISSVPGGTSDGIGGGTSSGLTGTSGGSGTGVSAGDFGISSGDGVGDSSGVPLLAVAAWRYILFLRQC